MSDAHNTPKRSRSANKRPSVISEGAGWRSSRRGTKSGKKMRRGIKLSATRDKITGAAERAGRGVKTGAWIIGWITGGVVATVVLVLVISLSVNGFARWNAKRIASSANSPEARLEKARDNLLLIGLDENGRAAGFLAIKIAGDQKAAYGIAIPDGAFIEVPGQGFERIGDSWVAGPDVSLDAVSNFFAVPFEWYASTDYEIYQMAMQNQSLAGVIAASKDTNLSDEDKARFAAALDAISSDNVALVPMPVKPINLGEQTYFEPQRAEIADLVKTWWGVDIGVEDSVTRVIIYNGAGVPGIAGLAAQQLIRAGYRVVDTKNADTFGYATTKVIVQNGSLSSADGVVKTLGAGDISQKPADQQVADIIVIIGKDYVPPAK
ncbi:MAG: LytR C-terminal domain-containing protein [Coriobacteriia bacterium]|nr:LytR C-terminal domain-containing protein [Coriobacteriia bacterium]